MSADLVKDLRFWNGGINSDKKMRRAADRIEQLEAALRHYVCDCVAPECEVGNTDFEICGLAARAALEGKKDD